MRLRLQHRLILMTVAVVVAVIVGLAWYQSSKEDGISTRTEVTETSIDVATSPAGTTFAFVWPAVAMRSAMVG